MNLIDVDVVGPQPAQRVFALAHDPLAARIAKNLTVTPFQPDLGGNDRPRAQTRLRDCLADDFLGATEAIDGRGIDESNAVFDRGSDRRDRIRIRRCRPTSSHRSPRCQSRCGESSARCQRSVRTPWGLGFDAPCLAPCSNRMSHRGDGMTADCLHVPPLRCWASFAGRAMRANSNRLFAPAKELGKKAFAGGARHL